MPDDPWFEEIDDFQWIWMFYSWLQDKKEQHEMFHDYGTFVGSFSNPEMAKKIWAEKNPQFSSTEEEFNESSRYVLEVGKEQTRKRHRRHRNRKVLNR